MQVGHRWCRLRASWVAALCSLAGPGCILDDVDYTGKACPCPEPDWVCDAAQRCARAINGQPLCTPRITADNFREGWRTPNTVGWRWDADPDGKEDDLAGYRVVVGPSEEAVASEDPDATRTFTQADSPELGAFLLHRTEDVIVEFTITDGFEPSDTPFGRLIALDIANCPFKSNIAAASPAVPPAGRIPFFDNSGLAVQAGTQPASYVVESGCGSEGIDLCLSCGSDCRNDTANLKIDRHYTSEELQTEMEVGAGTLNAATFPDAYLEVKIATDAPAPYWGEWWIRAHASDPETMIFRLKPFPVSHSGTYRTYQLPLRILVEGDTALTADALLNQADGIDQINVGAPWQGSTFVHVDDVSLRW